ncbi:MAG: methionine synthase [Oscillospiraceae bacterium]
MKGLIKINNNDILTDKIDKSLVLKYLGYEDNITIKDDINSILDECIEIIEKSSKPAFLYSYFDIKRKVSGTTVCGTSLVLKGKSIYNHLNNCNKVAILCLTLSNEIDKIITQSKFDVLRQLFLDMSASVYVEQLCEKVFNTIKNENKDLFATNRYGVGYGDFPLSQQEEVLTVINAQKRLGVMTTNEGILTPRKSITAVIGFSNKKTPSSYNSCDDCLLRNNCEYFMKGEHCGK